MPNGIRTISAAAGFIFLTFLVFYQVILNIGTHINGSPDDAYAIFWYLWWFKRSVLELHMFPSFTDFVESPFGVSLTNTTVINHVLALPLTYFSGPVASYNSMILVSFVLAGLGMYLLVFEVTGSFTASFFAGFVYSFSPYHVSFSATGGMDGAQVQYMPFALLFMVRYGRAGGCKNLVLFFLFTAFSILSFGYYAALTMFAVALYFLFMKILPFLFSFLSPGSHESAGPARIFILFAGVFMMASIAVSSVEPAPASVALSAFMAVSLAVVVLCFQFRDDVLKLLIRIKERYRALGRSERVVSKAGAAALIVFVVFFLAPVYGAAGRNISESYLVPAFSYFIPPVDHPVLGRSVPSWAVPSPDPFAGKMVYAGISLFALAAAGLRLTLKKTAAKEAQYFSILFLAGVLLLPPPHLKLGELDLYTPVYWFHKVFPPFVDVRRAIVLVILAGAVLAGISIKYLQDKAGGVISKAFIIALVFTITGVEFFPKVTLADVSRVPSAYAWLASRQGDFTIIEYPLTSIYDSRRYEVFFGQTIHRKKVVNPFGASGQEPGPSNERLNEVIGLSGPASEFFTSPDNAAGALSSLGVRYVVLRTDKTGAGAMPSMEGTFREAATFPDSVVLELKDLPPKAFVSSSGFFRPGYFLNYLERGSNGYSVKNPYIKPALSWSEGGPWLWMGKSAELNIIQNDKSSDGLYDLHFMARPAGGRETVLEIKDDDGNIHKLAIGQGQKEYAIKGLRVKPFDKKRLTLTVIDSGFMAAGGDFWESRGEQGLSKVSIGIRDLRAVVSGPVKGEKKPGIRSYDGIFAGGA